MKISFYLINLDSSVERLQRADAELKKHNITYQRISAVDGRQLNVQSYEGYDSHQAHQLMGRDLLGAEIGCYLSHIKAIETFLASDADYAVVLEDDLEIISDLNFIITEALTWLENQNIDWNLINIGKQKRKFSRKLQRFGQHNLLKAYYFPVRTLGLVWSRKGATEFLEQHQKIVAPIDVTLQAWLSESALGLSFLPLLVQPNGASSEIEVRDKNNITEQTTRTNGKRIPRHRRVLRNKYYALKNMLANK